MNAFACPRLRNRRTGAEIEINANPFSIGRGVSCNYVLASKAVSRVHCILEATDNVWVLKDTSTNGTVLNNEVLKHARSPPLKDNDVIMLELNGTESYLFLNDVAQDDISDEQLCAIADNVLNEMEYLTSNPVSSGRGEQQGATSLPPPTVVPGLTANPLLDHMYTTKSSNEENAKRPRMGRSPRSSLGPGGRSNSENAPMIPLLSQEGGTCSYNEASLLGTMDSESFCENIISISDSTGVSRNASSESPVRLGTNSSQSTETVEEDFRERTEDAVSSLQVNDLPGFSEAAVTNSEQAGPSTDKTEKPPEQPDSYEVVENELQCVICSELFIKALTLNCSHTFCKYCIGMWNKNKSDCPICRTMITSTTATIVLDNVIEKVIENSNDEIKRHRQTVLEERKKQEEAENKHTKPKKPAGRGQGQGQDRGRTATARRARGGRVTRSQTAAPRINVLDPVAINIGALVNNNVIEVSSDSDWSSDTESMSPTDLQDEYEADDWYDRSYWGGYGYCYRCGSPTHWANNCPNR